jgi:hypothetical protein
MPGSCVELKTKTKTPISFSWGYGQVLFYAAPLAEEQRNGSPRSFEPRCP